MELRTKCGSTITVGVGAKAHLVAHPEALALLAEAASLMTLPATPAEGQVMVACPDLGRIIGRSGCIETASVGADEPTMFFMRAGRSVPSRLAPVAQGPEVSTFVLITGYHGGSWRLYTGFAGTPAPMEPHDKNLRPGSSEAAESLAFWCRHALVANPSDGPGFESTWNQVLEALA